jgi:hypothetical protein
MLTVTDPIDRPDYHPMRAREPNPVTMKHITFLGDEYRKLLRNAEIIRKTLEAEIRQAKAAGHSYNQLATAAGEGFSLRTIQKIVEHGQGT